MSAGDSNGGEIKSKPCKEIAVKKMGVTISYLPFFNLKGVNNEDYSYYRICVNNCWLCFVYAIKRNLHSDIAKLNF